MSKQNFTLYHFHTNPDVLYGWEKSDRLPWIVVSDYLPADNQPPDSLFQADPEDEAIIAKDPESAFRYARLNLRRPWPEAEPSIMQSPKYAARYAMLVLHKRWRAAEPIIVKSVGDAISYGAKFMSGKGWPALEKEILESRDLQDMIAYTLEVRESRWPEAEKYLRTNSRDWEEYTTLMYDFERRDDYYENEDEDDDEY